MIEYSDWERTNMIDKTVNALKKNGFNVLYFESRQEALQDMLREIPFDALVAWGCSVTLEQVGILEGLRDRGQKLIEFAIEGESFQENIARRRQALLSDVYLTGTNAITTTGKLVNTDGTGNRVAAMAFGPGKVYIVAGINKIVENVEQAFDRIAGVAAPLNGKRLGRKTPCALNGRCVDCESSDRMCNTTVIMHKKARASDVSIILIGEELGY